MPIDAGLAPAARAADQTPHSNALTMSHHRHRRPAIEVVVPRPDRVRTLQGIAFGWIDAGLQHRGWLRVLSPHAIAVYSFLCLVGDRSGVSFYRRDRIARELGLGEREVIDALTRLRELDLVAFRPFRPGAIDGFHQVLALPDTEPSPLLPQQWISDLATQLRADA
jgi:hypothetical protein